MKKLDREANCSYCELKLFPTLRDREKDKKSRLLPPEISDG